MASERILGAELRELQADIDLLKSCYKRLTEELEEAVLRISELETANELDMQRNEDE